MRKLVFNLFCAAISIMAVKAVSIICTAESAKPANYFKMIEISERVENVSEQKIIVQRKSTLIPVTGQKRKEEVRQEEYCISVTYPEFLYEREWNNEDTYLLAKIAMMEAEGATIQCKTLVIMTVLNRVASDDFPDSIQEVIFQYDDENDVYQFSCIGNGRWDRVEPDLDCYEAVSAIKNSMYDYSGGALYFESCKEEENWHSRCLEFLYQCDNLRFYK